MTSRQIDLMLSAIKRQNEYDYKMEEDKQRINRNINEYKNKINNDKIIKNEIIKKRMEEAYKKKISKKSKKLKNIITHSVTKNPSESFNYNNKPLIPIIKDDIYNYINNYNFDRYKILCENEENRLKISKSVNFKINNHLLNKKFYMENIKNIFGEKNAEKKKKTHRILENFKKSNIDLRNRMNLEKAKRYHNFIKYLQKKEYDNEIYNDILNNKRILAKEKYDNYFKKKDELVLKRIRDLKYGRISDDYSDSFKIVNTISSSVEKIRNNNILKKIENKDVKRMKKLLDDNVVKLSIEKENNIRKILDNENEHFNKATSKINALDDNKKNSILNKVNNTIIIENKLKDAQKKYERDLKREIIYKKGNF